MVVKFGVASSTWNFYPGETEKIFMSIEKIHLVVPIHKNWGLSRHLSTKPTPYLEQVSKRYRSFPVQIWRKFTLKSVIVQLELRFGFGFLGV